MPLLACILWKAGPQLVQIPLASRSLHCSTAHQACGRWREKHGFSYNPSLRGPITDLPDWSYADGRPAPPMKGQLRRQEKNEAFARRAVMLSEEIDHALEKWEAQKREQEQQAEEKRHNRLVPKGSLLRQTSK
ncbi:39S ribosomal protein L52, mitochondrial isoform X3 [Hemicordylus capensis]|uniref:39S ribosomal protein L52, mitochondrial isoform X3 n=1 Tax=Hemicordylus capensis TaxID=884348 RepID=UPI002303C1C4|nr:39S ribosomal protein L52, mitochondrial isoform X3 [Hemicordylus capensis]